MSMKLKEEKSADSASSEEESSSSWEEESSQEVWEVDYIRSHRINESLNKIYFKTYWKTSKTTIQDFKENNYWRKMKHEIKRIEKRQSKITIFWKPSTLQPHNFAGAKWTLETYCAENEIDLNDFDNGGYN